MKESTTAFLSRREAARYLGICIEKFQEIFENQLPQYNFGPQSLRYKRIDIDRVAEEKFRSEPKMAK